MRSDRVAAVGRIAGPALFALILALRVPQGMTAEAWRLTAVTALMAVLWLTQAIPIAATSLIPLVAFPLLGIQSAEDVSAAYIDENVFLFLGGFIIALGIEKWGLHRRIALHVVRVTGTSRRRIVLGFMLATAFLSMWISNTASTLLMLPIALAVLGSLQHAPGEASATEDDPGLEHLSVALMLGIAYSASIGGLTTLVGTPTNVTFQGIWNDKFPEGPELSAGEWMATWVPLGIVFLLCAWGVVTARVREAPGRRLDRSFFTEKLRRLGPAGRGERLMLAVFAATALLWIFRKPLTLGGVVLAPGWGDLLAAWLSGWNVTAEAIHDSTVAVGMAVLMFFIPVDRDESGRRRCLMDWETAAKLPWGILLLIGGGFALAGGFNETKLDEWIGDSFADAAAGWPLWLVVFSACLLLTFLTELTSNVATVSALLPIFAAASVTLGLDPRLVMIPAAISTSCAFMLPIATPPNAIVFGSGRVRMGQMAAYGLGLNLVGAVLITLTAFVLLVPQLGISPSLIPPWAQPATP